MYLITLNLYQQSRGEFLSAIFLKVVELDFQECQKGDKMGDSVLAQSFGDRARLKSFFKEASGWMELGEGDREVPQRALEAFGGWISLFGLLSLASETEGPIMDPGYLLTEVRSFIGTLKDEQVFSFLQVSFSCPF